MQRMATFAIEENTRTRLSFTCRPWFTAGKRVEIRKKMLISAKIGKQNGDTRTRKTSLLRSLFAGTRFSPHVQAAYCSNTFHSNCLANHSLSTRIRNSSRKNLLIPKQRWRRMIKHCVKSPIISYFYFQRSSKECDSNNN